MATSLEQLAAQGKERLDYLKVQDARIDEIVNARIDTVVDENYRPLPDEKIPEDPQAAKFPTMQQVNEVLGEVARKMGDNDDAIKKVLASYGITGLREVAQDGVKLQAIMTDVRGLTT